MVIFIAPRCAEMTANTPILLSLSFLSCLFFRSTQFKILANQILPSKLFWHLGLDFVCLHHPHITWYFEPKNNCGFFKDFIYLFVERGEGTEKDRGRNISLWLHSHAPYWGPGLQPRHVPWLGIQPDTLWFGGWRSIHWATPARAPSYCYI